MNNYLDVFINAVQNLLEYIHNSFPDDVTLNTYFNCFKLASTTIAGKKYIVEAFIISVHPHVKYILGRDDRFFLDLPANDDDVNDGTHFSVALNLRHLWTHQHMSEKTKKAIWDRIITMVHLANEYQKSERMRVCESL